jgi:transcriptional regulator with XRE-family HTH domain
MNKSAHQEIRSRREALGLSDVQVAEMVGLSIDEYWDVEQHAHEIFGVTDLGEVRRLCEVLGFDVFQLLGVTCAFCEQSAQAHDWSLPRNQLIRRQRIALGLSEEELAEEIGFEKRTVQYLEEESEHLEGWSYELIEDLARVLRIPLQVLLGARCPVCAQ